MKSCASRVLYSQISAKIIPTFACESEGVSVMTVVDALGGCWHHRPDGLTVQEVVEVFDDRLQVFGCGRHHSGNPDWIPGHENIDYFMLRQEG